MNIITIKRDSGNALICLYYYFFLIIMTIEAGWYKIEWTKLTNKNTRVL